MNVTDQMRKDARSAYGHFSAWWWFGVPLLVIVLSYGPFLVMNCFLHAAGSACWRVSGIGQIIFDFAVYSSETAAAAVGLTNAAQMPSFFSALFFVLHRLIPGATTAELWLIVRIIFGTLTWWMASWTLSAWSDISRTARRVAASVLWVAIFLPLGFRQGIYSWYIPFGFLLLLAIARCTRLLEERKLIKAIIWTIIGLASSVVYPWFVLFAGFWFVGVWTEWAIPRLRYKQIAMTWAATSVLAVFSSLYLVFQFRHTVQDMMTHMTRNGMAFTNMPLLSTMLFAAGAWFVAILILALLSKGESSTKEFVMLLRAWIVTILAWCSSLFMGIFFQNDHFRILVLFFAWISAAVLLHWIHGIDAQKGRAMTFMVSLAAAIASFAYIAKPYAFDHDQLNAIHLFVWLALALVSACLAWSKWALRIRPRTLAVASIVFACCIGLPQYAVMFASENGRWESQQAYQPLFTWMRTSIPEKDTVCVDPANAEFIGSQSGRPAFFTDPDVYSLSSEILRDRLEAFASIRHIDESVAPIWTTSIQAKYVACQQFGLQRSALQRFMPEDRIDVLLGCDRASMFGDAGFIKKISAQFGVVNNSISATCPWIVVDASQKNAWNIPSFYQKKYDDGKFEVYQAGAGQ